MFFSITTKERKFITNILQMGVMVNIQIIWISWSLVLILCPILYLSRLWTWGHTQKCFNFVSYSLFVKVMDMRTHPEINMSGGGGYLLTATTIAKDWCSTGESKDWSKCYTVEPHLSRLFTYRDTCLGTNLHSSTESDSLIRTVSLGTELYHCI